MIISKYTKNNHYVTHSDSNYDSDSNLNDHNKNNTNTVDKINNNNTYLEEKYFGKNTEEDDIESDLNFNAEEDAIKSLNVAPEAVPNFALNDSVFDTSIIQPDNQNEQNNTDVAPNNMDQELFLGQNVLNTEENILNNEYPSEENILNNEYPSGEDSIKENN